RRRRLACGSGIRRRRGFGCWRSFGRWSRLSCWRGFIVVVFLGAVSWRTEAVIFQLVEIAAVVPAIFHYRIDQPARGQMLQNQPVAGEGINRRLHRQLKLSKFGTASPLEFLSEL